MGQCIACGITIEEFGRPTQEDIEKGINAYIKGYSYTPYFLEGITHNYRDRQRNGPQITGSYFYLAAILHTQPPLFSAFPSHLFSPADVLCGRCRGLKSPEVEAILASEERIAQKLWNQCQKRLASVKDLRKQNLHRKKLQQEAAQSADQQQHDEQNENLRRQIAAEQARQHAIQTERIRAHQAQQGRGAHIPHIPPMNGIARDTDLARLSAHYMGRNSGAAAAATRILHPLNRANVAAVAAREDSFRPPERQLHYSHLPGGSALGFIPPSVVPSSVAPSSSASMLGERHQLIPNGGREIAHSAVASHSHVSRSSRGTTANPDSCAICLEIVHSSESGAGILACCRARMHNACAQPLRVRAGGGPNFSCPLCRQPTRLIHINQ